MWVLPNKPRCKSVGDRRRASKIYRRRICEHASLFVSVQLLLRGNFFSSFRSRRFSELKFWKVGDASVELENCRMEPEQLDPKHSAELLKHLDKQNEFLQDSYELMFNELQKLQVEEEMLMRKLYEVMSPNDLAKKADNMEIANGDDTVDKHVENEQKVTGEIANRDDMVDKHQENGQHRTIKMADGDDAMDKNAENEQNRTSKIVSGDDTDNKPLENERNRAIEIANGDDTMDKPVENEQNSTRRSTRERKKAWKPRSNDE